MSQGEAAHVFLTLKFAILSCLSHTFAKMCFILIEILFLGMTHLQLVSQNSPKYRLVGLKIIHQFYNIFFLSGIIIYPIKALLYLSVVLAISVSLYMFFVAVIRALQLVTIVYVM